MQTFSSDRVYNYNVMLLIELVIISPINFSFHSRTVLLNGNWCIWNVCKQSESDKHYLLSKKHLECSSLLFNNSRMIKRETE